MSRGGPYISRSPNQLWKLTIRFIFAEDICHAAYFIWAKDHENAKVILDNIVHWPPFDLIESKLLDIHRPFHKGTERPRVDFRGMSSGHARTGTAVLR